MIILDGIINWSNFINYTQCPYLTYQTIMNPIYIETVAKKKGTSFHQFAHHYHRDNDKPPDIEYEDEQQQAFHEFEKERWIYCQKEGIPWKAKIIEKEIVKGDLSIIIDRLDDNGDGTYTLVEYKKKHYKTKDIPQMSFATIILKDEYDIEVSMWAIYYTEGDMYYKKPSKRSMNSMRRKMSLGTASMKAGYFPAKPGWHCKNCVYANEDCDFQGIKALTCADCGVKN